jgi:hypothetical protein
MINKEEMLVLLRSVAVPSDVEEGMGHAYDLGVEWERARVEKILLANKVDRDVMMDILNGVQYP